MRPARIRADIAPRWETPAPKGVVGTYGDAVIAHHARTCGRKFGAWQAYAIRQALRHDRNGDLLARIVLLSTGRQNGKTIIVQSLVEWLMDEGRKLPAFAGYTEALAAAHDAKQARKMYNRVRVDIEGSDELRGRFRTTQWAGISAGAIEFDTVTSQPGSARGSSAGLIAWDEMLTQRDWDMWEALGPTQSAQRSPIMLLTSTAGHADSVVLRAFYDRMVRQSSGDEPPDPTYYAAWWQSDDPDIGLDWPQVRRANPGMVDKRPTKQAIVTDHAILPPDSWRRERLNHWVDAKADGAFAPGVWAACRQPTPLAGLDGPYALAVHVQPGWERAAIIVAGLREDGRIGAEVYRDLRATEHEPVTADRIVAEVDAFPDPVTLVAFDGIGGGAQRFLRAADEGAHEWRGLKPNEMVAACMDTAEMILSRRLAVDDPLLDAQIAWTARRPVGQDGAFRFSSRASLGPTDAIFALVMAVHAVASSAGRPAIH